MDILQLTDTKVMMVNTGNVGNYTILNTSKFYEILSHGSERKESEGHKKLFF